MNFQAEQRMRIEKAVLYLRKISTNRTTDYTANLLLVIANHPFLMKSTHPEDENIQNYVNELTDAIIKEALKNEGH